MSIDWTCAIRGLAASIAAAPTRRTTRRALTPGLPADGEAARHVDRLDVDVRVPAARVRAEHRVAALDEGSEARRDHERDAGPRIDADLELPVRALLSEQGRLHLDAGDEEARAHAEVGLEPPLGELRALQQR